MPGRAARSMTSWRYCRFSFPPTRTGVGRYSRRNLTVAMIRAIHAAWPIALEALVGVQRTAA